MNDGNSAQPWTVARLLAWTRGHFERGGIESPRLCAELLLAHAMNCQRIHLYTRHDSVPDEAVRERYRALVRDAAGSRPIAYLIGRKEFFSLEFEVSPDVLIPRPETEILVERVIDLARRGAAADTILDLGTGSGCIAVALARHLPRARIIAIDIAPAALAVARRNAARHGVAERIEFHEGDLFGGAPPGQFDIIVSNPPYVCDGYDLPPSVRDFEPHVALFAGADGLNVVRRIAAEAPARLRAEGHLLVEIAYDQAAAARGLLEGGPWSDIVLYRDGGGIERVVHARRRESQVQVA